MKLLAFSGKKQSGKDSSAKFLIHYAHALFPMVEHESRRGKGEVQVYNLPSSVKTFYFGKPMKDFATDYLGVEQHKVWGTDAQKNELTHIKWETLPHYLKLVQKLEQTILYEVVSGKVKRTGEQTVRDAVMEQLTSRCPKGFMTGRELLQQIGEEMFLDTYPQIWTKKFEHTILAEQRTVDVGLVADPRKPEQIDTIHRLGGKVIRLLRDPYEGADRHISEIALDPPQYDQKNFDAIIDNRQMTVVQTRMQLIGQLMEWGWVRRPNTGLDIDWLLPEEKAEAA